MLIDEISGAFLQEIERRASVWLPSKKVFALGRKIFEAENVIVNKHLNRYYCDIMLRRRRDISYSEKYFSTLDGFKFFYRNWRPKVIRGIAILLHDLGLHSGFYKELCLYLADRGLSCYAADFRGHGFSNGTRGHIPRYEVLMNDLRKFMELVRSKDEGEVILVGHGFGSNIAFLQAISRGEAADLSGIVAISPFVGKRSVDAVTGSLLSRVLYALYSWKKISLESYHVICNKDLGEDSLALAYCTAKSIREGLRSLREVMNRLDDIEVPVLLQVPASNSLYHMEDVKSFYSRLRCERELRWYETECTDIFHSSEKDVFLEDLRGWIEKILKE